MNQEAWQHRQQLQAAWHAQANPGLPGSSTQASCHCKFSSYCIFISWLIGSVVLAGGAQQPDPKGNGLCFCLALCRLKKQLLNVCTWHHRTQWEGNSHQKTCRWATVTLLMFTSFFVLQFVQKKWHHHLSNSHFLPGDQGKNGQSTSSKSSSGSTNSDEESSDSPEPVETKAEEPGPLKLKVPHH